jgi:hypothetical protein
MKLKEVVRKLGQATEAGYEFSLHEGINLGPNKERLPKQMLRCCKFPGRSLILPTLPIVAVANLAGHALPFGGTPWLAACKVLGLSVEDGGLLLRAGEQIVVYNFDTGEIRAKHSKRLRRDMLAACGLTDK